MFTLIGLISGVVGGATLASLIFWHAGAYAAIAWPPFMLGGGLLGSFIGFLFDIDRRDRRKGKRTTTDDCEREG